MSLTPHYYPKFDEALLKQSVNVLGSSPDTFRVLLIASGGTHPFVFDPADVFVSDVLANSTGSGSLTEHSTSGTGYSRQDLSSLSASTSALQTTLTCGNPSWSSASISAAGALFFDNTGGADSARYAFVYWDFGGTAADIGGSFTLDIDPVNGLNYWTSAG